MTRVIPTSMTLPSRDDHLPGELVLQSKWQEIVEAQNYHWQRSGAICPGITFTDGTEFQTTSTSYTTANSNGDVDLDTWAGCLKFQRVANDGSGNAAYRLQFDAYLEEGTLRISWERFDDRTTRDATVQGGSVELNSAGSGSEWVRQTVTFTEDEVFEGGTKGIGDTDPDAVFYFWVAFKAESAQTGKLWQFGIVEERTTDATVLPGKDTSQEAELGNKITTDASDEIVFSTVAADTNTVLFLAPQNEFPGIKDWAGTLADTDLCDASSLEASGERGMYTGFSRKTSQYTSKAALQITGELVARIMLRTSSSGMPGTSQDLFDHGVVGDANENENFLYNMNAETTLVTWLSETTSQANETADWVMPGRFQSSTEYLLEARRDSNGDVSMYCNGLQLQRIDSSSGGTDNGDGTFGTTPTGGSNGVLCDEGLATNQNIDPYFLHICDAESSTTSASSYATNKREWTTAELNHLQRDDFATIAADGDVLVAIEPDASGLTDQAGTISTWDVTDTVTTSQLIGDHYWTDGGNHVEASDAAMQVTGDLTINVLAMANGANESGHFVAQHGPGDPAEADNHLYMFGHTSSTNLRYFAETGSGTNITVDWTVSAWSKFEIREYRLVREDAGGGNHNVRAYEKLFGASSWTQLTVAATSGSGAGTTEATVSQPSGGGNSTFQVNGGNGTAEDWSLREVAIYTAAKNPT